MSDEVALLRSELNDMALKYTLCLEENDTLCEYNNLLDKEVTALRLEFLNYPPESVRTLMFELVRKLGNSKKAAAFRMDVNYNTFCKMIKGERSLTDKVLAFFDLEKVKNEMVYRRRYGHEETD
jgi:hypothetical protein